MEDLFIFNNNRGGNIDLHEILYYLNSDYFGNHKELFKNVIIMDMVS